MNVKGIVAIPHLGASTEESEDNCAVMAAVQLGDYLANGNIANSVNFPAVSMPRSGDARICVLHKNVPAVISSITGICSEQGLNIENMTNKSRGDVAYTIIDLSGRADSVSLDRLKAIDGVIRVRILQD